MKFVLIGVAVGAVLGGGAGAAVMFLMPHPGPAEPVDAASVARVMGFFAAIGAVVCAFVGAAAGVIVTLARAMTRRA